MHRRGEPALEGGGLGLQVVRLEPDEFVSAADLAARTKRTRESIRLLVAGRRGPGGFPPPVRGVASRHRLWRWSEVATWFEACMPGVLSDAQLEAAGVISAVNAALHLRRQPQHAARDIIDRLAG